MRRPDVKGGVTRSFFAPAEPGRAKTVTHDYKRNGTIDLFTVLNVGTGDDRAPEPAHVTPPTTCWRPSHHRHDPADLNVLIVSDNLSARRAPARRGMARAPKRERWHLDFTPT